MNSFYYQTRDTLQYYSSCIATRGVIFSNSHRSNSITGAVSGGWRPLQKPQWFEAFKEVCITGQCISCFDFDTVTNRFFVSIHFL